MDKDNQDLQMWKDKYFSTLEQAETQQQSFSANLQKLRQSLAKICLVAEGSDKDLDFQLSRLRKQVHNNADLPIVLEQVENILLSSDIVENKTKTKRMQLNKLLRVFLSFGRSIGDDKKIIKALSKIEKKLKKELADVELIDLLEQTAEILNALSPKTEEQPAPIKTIEKNEKIEPKKSKKQSKQTEKSNSKQGIKKSTGVSGLFSMFSKNSEPREEIGGLVSSVNDLLEKLTTSEEYFEKAKQLKDELSEITEFNQLISAFQHVKLFIIDMVRHDRDEQKKFLAELNEKLEMLQGFLSSAEKLEELKQLEEDTHNEKIRENMQSIKENASSATSLNSLQLLIESKVNTMVEQMDHYREVQDQNKQKTEHELNQLYQRLKETEIVTSALMNDLNSKSSSALTDALTQLPNRQAYEERLHSDYIRWQQFEHELSIIVCDIDKFKIINDTYGHQAGDKVIKKVGEVLRDHFRKIDFVGRYGGEEYVILLEKTPQDKAAELAERARAAIQECQFHFRDQPVQITMSFGVYSFQSGDAIETGFDLADKALYSAKEQGRNQVQNYKA